MTVLLIDKHTGFRDALALLFSHPPFGYTVFTAFDKNAALALSGTISPNIILLDIPFRVSEAISSLHALRQVFPEAKLVTIGTLCNSFHAKKLIAAGANAYVCKTDEIATWKACMDQVTHGMLYKCPEAAGQAYDL